MENPDPLCLKKTIRTQKEGGHPGWPPFPLKSLWPKEDFEAH
jgi:hypothetical protein